MLAMNADSMESEMTQHAIENAQGWFQTIQEMVEAFQAEDDERTNTEYGATTDEIEGTIFDSVLSVQVRSGWYNPGEDAGKPAEYEILLTTGGPALRIIGNVDGDQPENARLQWQDWGTPWTDVHMSELLLHQPSDVTPSKVDEILLTFASVFYFGA